MSFFQGPTVQSLTEILQRDEYAVKHISELIGVLGVQDPRQTNFQLQVSSYDLIKSIFIEVVEKRGASATVGYLCKTLTDGGFAYSAVSYK